ADPENRWLARGPRFRLDAEVLRDLVLAAGHADVSVSGGRLVLPTLDTNYSYTVAFRHHNFHPLRRDPSGVWLIHVCPRDSPKPQQPAEAPEVADLLKIPRQECAFAESRDVSLARLSADEHSAGRSLERAIRGEGIHYGYVLRSRNPSITLTQSDILLDTSLLRFVRSCMYKPPAHMHADRVDHSNRLLYNIARVALEIDPAVRTKFVALFPELVGTLDRCTGMLKEITGAILSPAADSAADSAAADCRAFVVREISKQLRDAIKKRQPGFVPKHSSSRAIVEGYLYDPSNAYVLTLAVTKVDAEA
ncbi:MAG: DUF1553 domain-containing protein, partial [Sulfitobacter sp.]|nr:DUF1553 domain-containing protein [Sulfitobacter sp.]